MARNTNAKHKRKTQGITEHGAEMLQGFPAYTVHSAMHFEDFGYWPPAPAAKKTRPGKPAPAGEEEEYVFV